MLNGPLVKPGKYPFHFPYLMERQERQATTLTFSHSYGNRFYSYIESVRRILAGNMQGLMTPSAPAKFRLATPIKYGTLYFFMAYFDSLLFLKALDRNVFIENIYSENIFFFSYPIYEPNFPYPVSNIKFRVRAFLLKHSKICSDFYSYLRSFF